MNKLYTLEGYKKNKTLGNPLLARFIKLPNFNPMAFRLPSLPNFALPRFTPPVINIPKFQAPPVNIPKIQAPKISIPKIQAPKISVPKFQAPRISAPVMPRIQAPKFPSISKPKNPFSKKQKPDMSSSYEDFYNELEAQKERDFQPEPSYSEPSIPETSNEFTQQDMQMENDSIPVYGYDYNDVMLGAKKSLFSKSINLQKKLFNPGGIKFSLGRKKPTLLRKLTLKPGAKKVAKITPQEFKKGVAVTGAVAATIATAGTATPGLATVAGILGTTTTAIVTGAQYVAAGSALGSTLLASGGGDVASLLNTTGALLNNQTIKDNVPLVNSANTAINTGLDYYNTGSGIAEGLGLSAPSLGTNSQEFFSLFGKKENNVLDRSLQIDKTNQGQPSPLNTFKNPLTDPTSPLYTPPTGNKPTGQKGQTSIMTTDKNIQQIEKPNMNIALILGIGVLGYLFINKKGKK